MGAIYQADVWCDDCARHICAKIADANEAPANPDDERSFDSDDYPKLYDEENEESDSPQHCAGCGVFMENPLTSEGADYVKETVIEDIENGCTDSVACTEWFPHYDWIDWGSVGMCYRCGTWSTELEDEECPDCVGRPVQGDFTITPCGSLGGKSALARLDGEFIGEFDSDDAAIEQARTIMQEERFWPDIWLVSDHGNFTRVED